MCCVLGLAVAALWLGVGAQFPNSSAFPLTYRAQLVRAFTKVIIEITLALTVLLNIGTCICALTFSTVRA
jgi:hypothetical protein